MMRTRSSLLLRVKCSDDSFAWLEFDRLYRPMLYRYARSRGLTHADAEDVVQQSMASITQAMARFDYSRTKGGFKAWLHTVIDNAVKNHFRRRQPPQARTDRIANEPTPDASPAETWEAHWQEQHLLYCVDQCRAEVTPPTFEAFRLHVIEEWSPERVAEELNMSVDKVYRAKSRMLHRVRKKMAELVAAVEQGCGPSAPDLST